MRATSADGDSPSIARRMPVSVACRILSRSISSHSTNSIRHASARSTISGYSASRRASLSFLESFRPSIGRCGSRMTAATDTGPASGPRPASSTPAIRSGRVLRWPRADLRTTCRGLHHVAPCAGSQRDGGRRRVDRCRNDQFRHRIGSARGRIAAQLLCGCRGNAAAARPRCPVDRTSAGRRRPAFPACSRAAAILE